MAVKQSFLTTYATKVKANKVQMMKLHDDAPTIDDVGQTPENKVVKELKRIYIDQQNEKYKFGKYTRHMNIVYLILIRINT